MTWRHGATSTSAALCLALSLPPPALADDDLSALLAEPVETTAAKSAGTAASAPALSISLTSEDLRRYGIQTLAEAYNFLAMGLVSQDPLAEPDTGGRGVMLANDRNKHLLLLIDGHSTNNQESGASLHGRSLGLPMEIVDHIEVVLGPGSVLYGSNAMLGVVNVVTKRAKDYAGLHVVAEGSFSPPINRAHQVITPTLTSQYLRDSGTAYRLGLGGARQFELRGLPAELVGQIEYYDLDGPTMEWGPQSRLGINHGPFGSRDFWGGKTSRSYYARVPSGYVRLIVDDIEASVHVATSRVSQPYAKRNDITSAGDFDDPNAYAQRFSTGVDLKWGRNISTTTSLAARLYGDWATEQFINHDHGYFGCLDQQPETFCEYDQTGYARWIGTELQWTFDWPGHGRMSTMIGGDGRLRRVGYSNGAKEVDTGRSVVYSLFNDTQALGAVYAQHIYHPSRWLTVNGGLRLDADDRFGSRLLPRGAVVAEPWRGGIVKVVYSQAFRAPSADEVNYLNPKSALRAIGLRPEEVRSVEVILQQRFGAQSLIFGVYHSWWKDMIVRREFNVNFNHVNDEGNMVIEAGRRDGRLGSTVQFASQYRNVDSIDNFGFNGGYDGTLASGRLAYGLNLTAGYARLEQPDGNRRLPVSPSMFGNARVSYDLSDRLPAIALAAHFSDRRLSEAGDTSGFVPLPFAPPALDVRATASGRVPRIERLTYRLQGNYAFASSSPYTAGRNSLVVAYQPHPELAPNVRFTVMLLLQYDLELRH